MSRRRKQTKRDVSPDPVYKSKVVTKFMNSLMYQGKKTVAEKILYKTFELIKTKTNDDPLKIFNDALKNVKPNLEVKSRRVGGATYQVPVEVRPVRQLSLAIRWLTDAARKRNERTMAERLANELLEAFRKQGKARQKRDELHKLAEANSAYIRYRWW